MMMLPTKVLYRGSIATSNTELSERTGSFTTTDGIYLFRVSEVNGFVGESLTKQYEASNTISGKVGGIKSLSTTRSRESEL